MAAAPGRSRPQRWPTAAHAFTSKAMDAAGNVSSASAALNVTVDTVAPGAPTVVSFSPDSNVVGDGITNVNHADPDRDGGRRQHG